MDDNFDAFIDSTLEYPLEEKDERSVVQHENPDETHNSLQNVSNQVLSHTQNLLKKNHVSPFSGPLLLTGVIGNKTLIDNINEGMRLTKENMERERANNHIKWDEDTIEAMISLIENEEGEGSQ